MRLLGPQLPLSILAAGILTVVMSWDPPVEGLPLPDSDRDAITETTQAFIQKNHLNERNLTSNIRIAWENGAHWGYIQPKGEIGSSGHEKYDVIGFDRPDPSKQPVKAHFVLEISPTPAP